jgi:magnesium-transporting ATPase (P-type)
MKTIKETKKVKEITKELVKREKIKSSQELLDRIIQETQNQNIILNKILNQKINYNTTNKFVNVFFLSCLMICCLFIVYGLGIKYSPNSLVLYGFVGITILTFTALIYYGSD